MVDPELEHAYMPSLWNHQGLDEMEVLMQHQARGAEETTKARQDLTSVLNVQYGKTPKNVFDLYFSSSVIKPGGILFAYIHGGYWNAMSKEDSANFARAICNNVEDAVFVVVDYVLASEKIFGDRTKMKSMWNEMTTAYAALSTIADELKCSGIYLCGHSAGAHLAAAMLSNKHSNSTRKRLFEKLRGVWLLAGVFNLDPISKTSVNDPLQLSEEEIMDCSPINRSADIAENLAGALSCSVRTFYGEFDPPAFHKESQEFVQKLKSYFEAHPEWDHVKLEPPVQVPNRDHFDLVDELHENHVLSDILEILKRDIIKVNGVDIRDVNFQLLLRTSGSI